MKLALRKAIHRRADGACESCSGPLDDPSIDHFFGRRHGDALETCWLLCFKCHRAKTESRPSAQAWLNRYSVWASLAGYTAAAKRAQDKLAVQVFKFGEKK